METKRSNSRKGCKCWISLHTQRPTFFTVESLEKENEPSALLFPLAASFSASGHMASLIYPLIIGRQELEMPCWSRRRLCRCISYHIIGNCSMTHTVRLGVLGVELRTKWEGFPFPRLVSKNSLFTHPIFNVSLLLGWSASWRKIRRPIGKVSACFFLSWLCVLLCS